jgi:uncharacterized membrane protein
MKTTKLVLTYLFGAFLIVAGIGHLLHPQRYFPFIPDFLPKEIVNYLSGLLEIVVGIGVFILRFKNISTFTILLMMIAFLPLHIIDVFKEHPAIGSHTIALIRLPLQFLLIYWAWYICDKKYFLSKYLKN